MREAEVNRKTNETDISIKLNLDGAGKSEIETGIGFFDHMLTSFSKHSLIDLQISCKGDLIVDCHHTIEDVGIALGFALKKAIGNKYGINRFGDCTMPMDDALILCAIDLSGRGYLGFDASFNMDRVGYYDTEMVKEFFYALAINAGFNLHLRQLAGSNTHHIIEGMYKAFAVALRKAVEKNPRIEGILSTKGSL